MPLSREQFQFFYNQIKDESRDASELLGNTRVVILEDVEEILKGSDVQTVQGTPKITVERVKGMIEEKIKEEQEIVKQERDYIIIQAMKYGIATLKELLQEISEAENALLLPAPMRKISKEEFKKQYQDVEAEDA